MDYFGFLYAAIVATGGIIGYAKAGSIISLCMGLLFGGLSAFGSYKISVNSNDIMVLFCTSFVLMTVMGFRSMNSGKFMPAGLVATLSLGTVMRLLPTVFE